MCPLLYCRGLCYNFNMFKKFYPDKYIDSAYNIDFDEFYQKGYRAILFDIDNTLVPHGAPLDERSRKLLMHLKEMGYGILFLSNNKEPRVKSFSDPVGGQYIYKANKPRVKGYLKAMEMLGTEKGNTLFVGDQLFTDIWGARNAGIYAILVGQVAKKEEIQIVLKRILEKVVLFFYRRYCNTRGIAFIETKKTQN